MGSLLCAVGLHARIRDREVAPQWLISMRVDEYRCRRCPARWELVTIVLGDGYNDTMWERVI
jgi:hypothetical protein